MTRGRGLLNRKPFCGWHPVWLRIFNRTNTTCTKFN